MVPRLNLSWLFSKEFWRRLASWQALIAAAALLGFLDVHPSDLKWWNGEAEPEVLVSVQASRRPDESSFPERNAFQDRVVLQNPGRVVIAISVQLTARFNAPDLLLSWREPSPTIGAMTHRITVELTWGEKNRLEDSAIINVAEGADGCLGYVPQSTRLLWELTEPHITTIPDATSGSPGRSLTGINILKLMNQNELRSAAVVVFDLEFHSAEDCRKLDPSTKNDEPTLVSDNFEDGAFGQFWGPTDKALIYEEAGALNFLVTFERSVEDVYGTLPWLIDARKLMETSFTITLLSHKAGASGGAGLDIFLTDERLVSIDVGPGTEDPPEVYISVCRAPLPDEEFTPDSECDHPNSKVVEPGIPVLVEVFLDQESVAIHVDRIPAVSVSLNGAEPGKFQFYVSGDVGSEFQVAIDDFQAVY